VSKLIAIIDDEVEMEDIYKILLEQPIRKGLIELKFFCDARVFVDWLKSHSPDLVLTDINMPHINGVMLIKHIRSCGRKVPTYFVSGDNPLEFEPLMRKLDVDRFLSKPFNFNHILNLIQLDLGIISANLEW
jgi:DNA-binding NtrC family response regulator